MVVPGDRAKGGHGRTLSGWRSYRGVQELSHGVTNRLLRPPLRAPRAVASGPPSRAALLGARGSGGFAARCAAVAVVTASAAIAAAIGPLIGGFLTTLLSWRVGFVLEAVNRLAYPELPEETQLLWYKTLRP